MWTGLIRRFTEDSQLSPGSDHHHHHHHQQPDDDDDDDRQQLGYEAARSPGGRDDGVTGVFTPPGRRTATASPFRPPPLEPLILKGYRDNTPQQARLLTHVVAEEIRTMVPERLRIVEDWRLVYSLEQDGASLATLYQKCRRFEGRRVGFVLVVKDEEGGVSLL